MNEPPAIYDEALRDGDLLLHVRCATLTVSASPRCSSAVRSTIWATSGPGTFEWFPILDTG